MKYSFKKEYTEASVFFLRKLSEHFTVGKEVHIIAAYIPTRISTRIKFFDSNGKRIWWIDVNNEKMVRPFLKLLSDKKILSEKNICRKKLRVMLNYDPKKKDVDIEFLMFDRD